MSMETYERQMAIVDVYKKLLEAEITNGALLIDGEEVFRKLRIKHGKQGV